MTNYFKSVSSDGYVLGVGICSIGNITKEEYERLTQIIHDRPIPRDGYTYRLKDISYEWEEYPLPEDTETDEPIPEPEEPDADAEI